MQFKLGFLILRDPGADIGEWGTNIHGQNWRAGESLQEALNKVPLDSYSYRTSSRKRQESLKILILIGQKNVYLANQRRTCIGTL